MRPFARALVAVVAAVVVSTALSGCAGPSEKTVDYTADSVTLHEGEILVVDFGEINSSVGDAWVITQEPDAAVLGPGEEKSHYLGEEGSVGGPNELEYRFPAAGVGTTVVEFEYEFRGEVPEDPADQKSARIEVTVE